MNLKNDQTNFHGCSVLIKMILVFFLLICLRFNLSDCSEDDGTTASPKQDYSMKTLVKNAGHTLEEHYVTTDDGYILMVHRIPFKSKSGTTAPVVLLVHGMISRAAQWVVGNSSNSIAFSLADNGFDVWMLNYRGTSYSRNHTKLDPNKSEFWNFSFDEMGQFDIPATIDHIISKTGVSKINYLGHSMGSTGFFVDMAIKPTYNQKINHMIAWAPVVLFTGASSMMKSVAQSSDKLKEMLEESGNSTGEISIARNSQAMKHGVEFFKKSPTMAFMMAKPFCGGDVNFFDWGLRDKFMQHFPDSVSLKTALHWGQIVRTGLFNRYDEGEEGNLRRYNHTSPPAYNLTLVSSPVTLIAADGDPLTPKEDVENLPKLLPNIVERFTIKRKTFGHLSFFTSTDVPAQVVQPTIERMLKHNSMKKD